MTVMTVNAPNPEIEEQELFRQAIQESMDRRDQGGE